MISDLHADGTNRHMPRFPEHLQAEDSVFQDCREKVTCENKLHHEHR